MDKDQIHKRGVNSYGKRIKIDFLIHDLKVPLAVIEAGITLLLERHEKYGPLTDKQRKVLLRALRNTRTTQALVNDAMELARSREGIVNLARFRISSLIEQTLVELFDLTDCGTSEKITGCSGLTGLREVLREKGILLFIGEHVWCQEVCLDQTRVRQILRNLLNNALKYRKSRVDLEFDSKDGYLIFSVKDDGMGIPSIYHKKIFDSYFQMDAPDSLTVRGHGLGLAGVLALIEDMRGRLFLESDKGKGAKFLVKLPLTIK